MGGPESSVEERELGCVRFYRTVNSQPLGLGYSSSPVKLAKTHP